AEPGEPEVVGGGGDGAVARDHRTASRVHGGTERGDPPRGVAARVADVAVAQMVGGVACALAVRNRRWRPWVTGQLDVVQDAHGSPQPIVSGEAAGERAVADFVAGRFRDALHL